jgi:hypothetical protein
MFRLQSSRADICPSQESLFSRRRSMSAAGLLSGLGHALKALPFGIAISMDGLKKQTVEKNQANARMRVSSRTFTDSEIMLAGARLF